MRVVAVVASHHDNLIQVKSSPTSSSVVKAAGNLINLADCPLKWPPICSSGIPKQPRQVNSVDVDWNVTTKRISAMGLDLFCLLSQSRPVKLAINLSAIELLLPTNTWQSQIESSGQVETTNYIVTHDWQPEIATVICYEWQNDIRLLFDDTHKQKGRHFNPLSFFSLFCW